MTYQEQVEENIWIRNDGTIVYESILEKWKWITAEELKRILILVGDNIHNEKEIDWASVWREFYR